MTKKKNQIETQAEAERVMQDLCEIDSDLTKFIFMEAEAVAKARQNFYQGAIAKERTRMLARKKELEKKLKNFAETDKDNWTGQTKKTPGGVFGFRWSPHAVFLITSIAKNLDVALVNLQADYQQFVRRVPTINKEIILQRFVEKKLDIDGLHECGLKVKRAEKFFIKTKFSEALEKVREQLKNA